MTMSDSAGRLKWERPFLAALAKGHSVRKAAETAAIASSTAYWHRGRNARFAQEWAEAQGAKAETAAPGAAATEAPRHNHWRKAFLDALAETSNVSAAAARVNVPTQTAYKLRREDRDFAAKWLAALNEGYDNLEMELVGYLRDPEPKRKMDVTAALRLLAAHRETVERRRALNAEEDERATLDSLDAFFEGLRQRRIANEAILNQAANDDESE
jgi:hypothetical protein